jgi:hypothetical protein
MRQMALFRGFVLALCAILGIAALFHEFSLRNAVPDGPCPVYVWTLPGCAACEGAREFIYDLALNPSLLVHHTSLSASEVPAPYSPTYSHARDAFNAMCASVRVPYVMQSVPSAFVGRSFLMGPLVRLAPLRAYFWRGACPDPTETFDFPPTPCKGPILPLFVLFFSASPLVFRAPRPIVRTAPPAAIVAAVVYDAFNESLRALPVPLVLFGCYFASSFLLADAASHLMLFLLILRRMSLFALAFYSATAARGSRMRALPLLQLAILGGLPAAASALGLGLAAAAAAYGAGVVCIRREWVLPRVLNACGPLVMRLGETAACLIVAVAIS